MKWRHNSLKRCRNRFHHARPIQGVKWFHSNLQSQYRIYLVGQHGYCTKLTGKAVLRYLNKNESFSFRKSCRITVGNYSPEVNSAVDHRVVRNILFGPNSLNYSAKYEHIFILLNMNNCSLYASTILEQPIITHRIFESNTNTQICKRLHSTNVIITFHTRRSQCKMYIGHRRLCVSVPRHIPTTARTRM